MNIMRCSGRISLFSEGNTGQRLSPHAPTHDILHVILQDGYAYL